LNQAKRNEQKQKDLEIPEGENYFVFYGGAMHKKNRTPTNAKGKEGEKQTRPKPSKEGQSGKEEKFVPRAVSFVECEQLTWNCRCIANKNYQSLDCQICKGKLPVKGLVSSGNLPQKCTECHQLLKGKVDCFNCKSWFRVYFEGSARSWRCDTCGKDCLAPFNCPTCGAVPPEKQRFSAPGNT